MRTRRHTRAETRCRPNAFNATRSSAESSRPGNGLRAVSRELTHSCRSNHSPHRKPDRLGWAGALAEHRAETRGGPFEMNVANEHLYKRAALRDSAPFVLSVVVLVAASAFAGAMLRPLAERWWRSNVPSAGELALVLEHAAVDVRLGRAAPLVDRLGVLAAHIREPATRERVLGLWTEAALQAGRLV